MVCLAASAGLLLSALDAEKRQDCLIEAVVRNLFQIEADDLDSELIDWAQWDQMRAHALGRDPSFPRDVYSETTYRRTPLMVVFGRDWHAVSASTWDAGLGFQALQPAALAALKAQLPSRDLEAQAFLGSWNGQAALFMLEPIYGTADISGRQPAGMLLFARQFGEQSVFRASVKNWGAITGIVGDRFQSLQQPIAVR